MQHTPLTRRAINATWWSTLEIASRYGVQIIVTIFLARLLQPADFGLIAMLLVFTSISAILINSGFGAALVQRQQITVDDETTVFVFAICSGLLLAGILWLCAPAISEFYRQPALVPLTHLIIWILPLGAFAAVPDALLTKRLNFAARARAEIVASGISGFVAILLAWDGYGIWSLGWQMILAMGLRAMLLWYAARWKPRGRFTSTSFHRLFGFGSFMLLAQLLDTTFIRLQALLLGRMFDAGTLGYYSLAQNAQQAPTMFMGTVLNRVGLPVFSEIADQPVKLRNALCISLRASLFVFLPCMIGLALAAKPLIILVYGVRWEASAPILTLLALAASIWPIHVLNLAAITATGRSDLLFRIELVKKAFSITLVIVSSPFGPIAVAGSVLVSSLLGTGVNTWYSKHRLGYGLLAQLMDQKGTFALCAICALTGWSILHWTRAGTVPTLAAISISALAYLGGAWLFHNPALKALTSMMRPLSHHGSEPPDQGGTA